MKAIIIAEDDDRIEIAEPSTGGRQAAIRCPRRPRAAAPSAR